MTSERVERRLAAVLAADVAGYSRLMGRDEEGTLVRHWPLWTAGAFTAFFLWIIPAALIAKVPNMPVKALSVIGDLGLVIFAAAAWRFSVRLHGVASFHELATPTNGRFISSSPRPIARKRLPELSPTVG